MTDLPNFENGKYIAFSDEQGKLHTDNLVEASEFYTNNMHNPIIVTLATRVGIRSSLQIFEHYELIRMGTDSSAFELGMTIWNTLPLYILVVDRLYYPGLVKTVNKCMLNIKEYTFINLLEGEEQKTFNFNNNPKCTGYNVLENSHELSDVFKKYGPDIQKLMAMEERLIRGYTTTTANFIENFSLKRELLRNSHNN